MEAGYPVLIKKHESAFLVYIPDLELYTEGYSFDDAIEMAKDAIAVDNKFRFERGQEIPAASDADEAIRKAKADADDSFDYSDGELVFIRTAVS